MKFPSWPFYLRMPVVCDISGGSHCRPVKEGLKRVKELFGWTEFCPPNRSWRSIWGYPAEPDPCAAVPLCIPREVMMEVGESKGRDDTLECPSVVALEGKNRSRVIYREILHIL